MVYYRQLDALRRTTQEFSFLFSLADRSDSSLNPTTTIVSIGLSDGHIQGKTCYIQFKHYDASLVRKHNFDGLLIDLYLSFS